MTNEYARSLQLPTGIMECRDLIAGDVVLRRCEGSADLTPHEIIMARPSANEIEIMFGDGESTLTSPQMKWRLAD